MSRRTDRADNTAETQGASPRPSRRQVIALGGAAAAAAVLVVEGPRAAQAATGDPLILGQGNTAGDPTRLDTSLVPPDEETWMDSFRVWDTSGRRNSVAIAGISAAGVGVVGSAIGVGGQGVLGKVDGNGVGVTGFSGEGRGVEGISSSATGVRGQSQSGSGVEGISQTGFGMLGISYATNGYGIVGTDAVGTGVHGKSASGVGVDGWCMAGPGVLGHAPGDHPGVRAESRSLEHELDGGVALEVVGKARFFTAGEGAIPPDENSVFVANDAVTASSHITVVLTSDPGVRQIRWIERGAGGFTIHLTPAPAPRRPAIDFTYLIVEPVIA